MTFTGAAVGFTAAFFAGGVNSIAGGGTLITFPTLIWLGLPSVTANATNTIAVWPGSLGGMWGYRGELRAIERRLLAFTVPALIGGIVGALLLRFTPAAVFDRIVPFLILFATLLFMAQEPIQRRFKRTDADAHRSAGWFAGALTFQLFVGIYGGYFGAGIGILTLASLSILGLKDIHQMNGLKNLMGMCTNGVAAIYFIWAGMVFWPYAILMAAGATAGGLAGAKLARRLGRKAVRWIVIGIGLGMSAWLFVRSLS